VPPADTCADGGPSGPDDAHAGHDHDDHAGHDHDGDGHAPDGHHDDPGGGGRADGGHAGHGHSHGSIRAGERHKGPMVAAFGVLATFMVVEFVAGFATGSLALLSDAGHMLTDVAGIGMALAAIQLATRSAAGEHRTFGLYRLEILAALANAVLLLGVAAYVLVEAVGRFSDAPDVPGTPLLVVATLGLAANVVAFLLLREGSRESLNVEGAYLEVLADTLGSVGVIIGALAIRATGWTWIDPAVGVAIAVWVVPRTLGLASRAIRILIQAAPPGVDLPALQAELAGVCGVVDVHDLHVWTLTSEMDVASAHLMVGTGSDAHAVLDQARAILQQRYGIAHATLQVEPEDHRGCDDVTW
jgi:cobalt-zinc-cadmium efflux system protein